jgi:hypothetical protein
MRFNPFLKLIAVDRTPLDCVVLSKNHIETLNGHCYVKVKHDMNLELEEDEVVLLNHQQCKQINAMELFVFSRESINHVPIKIQKRAETKYFNEIERFAPKVRRPFKVRFNAQYIYEMQRAMALEARKNFQIELEIDLNQPEGYSPISVRYGNGEGFLMPMKLDADQQESNKLSAQRVNLNDEPTTLEIR